MRAPLIVESVDLENQGVVQGDSLM